MTKCLVCVEDHLKNIDTHLVKTHTCTQKAVLTFCGYTEVEVTQEEDKLPSEIVKWAREGRGGAASARITHAEMVLPRTADGHIHPVVFAAAVVGFACALWQAKQAAQTAAKKQKEMDELISPSKRDDGETNDLLSPNAKARSAAVVAGLDGLRRRSSLEV